MTETQKEYRICQSFCELYVFSFEGSIVPVADVYDALTSRRSYKEPWS